MTSQDPDNSSTINRRTLLKTTGATAFGIAAFTGSASARQHSLEELRFCGCGRVCVDSDERYRVVFATEEGGETSCRLSCVSSDPRCYSAGSEEKVIGVLDTADNLFSNPNNCARKPLENIDLSDCADDQGWDSASPVTYNQTGKHEYEVADMEVTVRTKRCKSPEEWNTSHSGSPGKSAKPGKENGTKVIDDFERDGPLDEYSVGTENYSVEMSTVFEGSKAVTKDTFGAPYSIVSNARLDYYPEHGDNITLYFKNAADDNYMGFHFFTQSEVDNPEGYTVGISGSSAWKMWKNDGDISTIAEQDLPASEQISGWYRVEISTDSTTVYSDLYDDENDELLASIQADDSTFGSGGIGFRALGNGEVWDSVVRTSTRPLTPSCSIVGPSDGDTVEGTVTVQVDARDAEDYDDNLDVEVAIGPGDWQTATYNCSTGRYDYDWDSDDGDDDYTIYARATDSDGLTTDADPVTVYSPTEGADPGDFEPGIRHSLYDGPVGGGDGMPSSAINSTADADIVVSDGDLQSAIDSSSRGDVIYVEGSATATAVTQDEITIAGNRGEGDDGHINDPDIDATNVRFDGLVVDIPDHISITERGWECFNCEFSGAGYFDIDSDRLLEPAIEFKQCEIHDMETYKTIQCGYMSGDDVEACGNTWHMPSNRNRIRIVYCEWYHNSKIAGTQYYFEVIDNHLKDTATSGAFLELRAPNACRISGSGSVNACGSPCGTGIVQHNLNEMVDDDEEGVKLLQSRGTPWRDPAFVRRNDAPVNTEWDAGCEANDTFDHAVFADQIALQNASGAGKDTLDNIVVEDNILS